MNQPSTAVSVSRSRRRVPVHTAVTAVVILAATVVPRLMVIGGLPATDEGFYAYFAQFIHASLVAGRGLPDSGTLVLYPILVSWAFGLATNHLIALRLADLLVAAAASWLLYRVIERESGSRVGGALISLVFLFTMNQPAFIQCGFKNSIFAAYVPLFLAVRLVQHPGAGTRVAWGAAGALTALAVLFRETFLPFLVLGALAIVVAHGWRACLRFSRGAAGLVLLFISVVSVARGGIAALIHSYRDAGAVYASVADTRAALFIANGMLSAKEAAASLVLGALIATCAGFCRENRLANFQSMAFWLLVALVPLLEPASKSGYPYHFAACLPGLAGLAASGWRSAIAGRCSGTEMRLAIIAALVCALFLLPNVVSLARHWPASRNALQCAGTGAWPAEAIVQSNYLEAAEAIRKVAPANGTLSVSGFMYPLYPLTGLLPPSNDLSNLSATLIRLGSDGARLRQALLVSPPDVLMTTTRTDWPGAATVTKAVLDSGLYEPVTTIQAVPDKSYGDFGGTVYVRIGLAKRK